MEVLLKETLASFLKIDAASISPATVIDRSALGNSILLHRMYARFSQQGIDVANYSDIRTFGDLVERVRGTSMVLKELNHSADIKEYQVSSINESNSLVGLVQIGIDIESIHNFEIADDYREAPFYKNNFSAKEISYCLFQANTMLSFAGLFAAKEAIIKADNSSRGKNFNTIEISHDKQGKPYYKNFSISISHTDSMAVAVAFAFSPIDSLDRNQKTDSDFHASLPSNTPPKKNYQLIFALIALLSLAVSIFSLLKFSR